MSGNRKKRNRRNPPRRKVFDKDLAWLTIKSSLVGGMLVPQTEEGHRALMIRGYTALGTLESGHLNHEGYYWLNFMNTLFFCLCVALDEQGSEAVKEAMQENIRLAGVVSDALVAINERYARLKRYGGTGQQLQQVREMMVELDQLAGTAPVGVVLKSIQAAQEMIDRYLGTKTRSA